MTLRYPFSAIAGLDELKTALLLTAVDPLIGGLLAFGDRGTGKSTAVRALAALLPNIRATTGCAYHCDPDQAESMCDACRETVKLKIRNIPIPVVDLPLGATEDRVIGSLDLEKALTKGEKAFEPGLLAQANRGYLYVDEVNLLEDHIVDLLLDVAASGENVVEREGLSIRHPARVVLVGSGNPEEGELRPQLLDRFGLSVDVRTPTEVKDLGRDRQAPRGLRTQSVGLPGNLEQGRVPDPPANRCRPQAPHRCGCAGCHAGTGCSTLHPSQDRWLARTIDADALRPGAGRL
jgi:magnesium chelatase subunit I